MEKRLPLGNSDFKNVITGGCYYVDKTLLIKELLDGRSKITLIPRPRRFGKSLNMSMLQYFFEKKETSERELFSGLAIEKAKGDYMEHQGKYPVVFLTFKDVNFESFDATFQSIQRILAQEFSRHVYLLESDKLEQHEKAYVSSVLDGSMEPGGYEEALKYLILFLEKHYEEKVIVCIDEYDVPLQSGLEHGFFGEIQPFISRWLSAGLKDHTSVQFAVMTGMLCMEKELVFSQMNNVSIATFLDRKFGSFFGFTREDLDELLVYYGCDDKYEEIRKWYGGYRFGGIEIYNPWSVVNYFDKGMRPQIFIPIEKPIAEMALEDGVLTMQHTDGNVLGQCLAHASDAMQEELIQMFAGKRADMMVSPNIVYKDVLKNEETIFSYLLMAGYLAADEVELEGGAVFCKLRLVNREISCMFRREILARLNGWITETYTAKLTRAVRRGDDEKVKEYMSDLIFKLVNNMSRNVKFYHSLMLMLSAMFVESHEVRSFRDAGVGEEAGRFGKWDLLFVPKSRDCAGIILKMQTADAADSAAQAAARQALAAPRGTDYAALLKEKGVEKMYQYAVAVPVIKPVPKK